MRFRIRSLSEPSPTNSWGVLLLASTAVRNATAANQRITRTLRCRALAEHAFGNFAELVLGQKLLAVQRVLLDRRRDRQGLFVARLDTHLLEPHLDRINAAALAHHHYRGRLPNGVPAHREELGRVFLAAVLVPAR